MWRGAFKAGVDQLCCGRGPTAGKLRAHQAWVMTPVLIVLGWRSGRLPCGCVLAGPSGRTDASAEWAATEDGAAVVPIMAAAARQTGPALPSSQRAARSKQRLRFIVTGACSAGCAGGVGGSAPARWHQMIKGMESRWADGRQAPHGCPCKPSCDSVPPTCHAYLYPAVLSTGDIRQSLQRPSRPAGAPLPPLPPPAAQERRAPAPMARPPSRHCNPWLDRGHADHV